MDAPPPRPPTPPPPPPHTPAPTPAPPPPPPSHSPPSTAYITEDRPFSDRIRHAKLLSEYYKLQWEQQLKRQKDLQDQGKLLANPVFPLTEGASVSLPSEKEITELDAFVDYWMARVKWEDIKFKNSNQHPKLDWVASSDSEQGFHMYNTFEEKEDRILQKCLMAGLQRKVAEEQAVPGTGTDSDSHGQGHCSYTPSPLLPPTPPPPHSPLSSKEIPRPFSDRIRQAKLLSEYYKLQWEQEVKRQKDLPDQGKLLANPVFPLSDGVSVSLLSEKEITELDAFVDYWMARVKWEDIKFKNSNQHPKLDWVASSDSEQGFHMYNTFEEEDRILQKCLMAGLQRKAAEEQAAPGTGTDSDSHGRGRGHCSIGSEDIPFSDRGKWKARARGGYGGTGRSEPGGKGEGQGGGVGRGLGYDGKGGGARLETGGGGYGVRGRSSATGAEFDIARGDCGGRGESATRGAPFERGKRGQGPGAGGYRNGEP